MMRTRFIFNMIHWLSMSVSDPPVSADVWSSDGWLSDWHWQWSQAGEWRQWSGTTLETLAGAVTWVRKRLVNIGHDLGSHTLHEVRSSLTHIFSSSAWLDTFNISLHIRSSGHHQHLLSQSSHSDIISFATGFSGSHLMIGGRRFCWN